MKTSTLLIGTGVIVVVVVAAYLIVQTQFTEHIITDEPLSPIQPSDAPVPNATMTQDPGATTTTTATTVESDTETAQEGSGVPTPPPLPTETTAEANEPAPPSPTPTVTGYTITEVAQHGDKASCWTAVEGVVYNLTPFIERHPGGVKNIMKICGIDGTAAFERKHGNDDKPQSVLTGLEIGTLVQ